MLFTFFHETAPDAALAQPPVATAGAMHVSNSVRQGKANIFLAAEAAERPVAQRLLGRAVTRRA